MMSFEDLNTITKKSADTFSFSQQERAEILSSVGESLSDVLDVSVTPDKEVKRKIETLAKKEISLSLHCSTLAEYAKVARIPRGLRCTLLPFFNKEDKQFMDKWYAILNRCSLDLMIHTIQGLQSNIKSTQQELVTATTELKSRITSENFNKFNIELQASLADFRADLVQKKLHKYRRDTLDYESDRVYTWAAERKRTRTQERWRRGLRTPMTSASTRDQRPSSSTASSGNSRSGKAFLATSTPQSDQEDNRRGRINNEEVLQREEREGTRSTGKTQRAASMDTTAQTPVTRRKHKQ
ncbi:uncharacterized protein LOC121399782 [Xenopus laevis]|uniref:Uncharacterized protein LOC121399782 n=1 Tax=Xenopus laevis TaxID=8355 RepID=A0A8J1M6I6_XENLA|nr:uncharacterized protein LOC121399782 [Xenopus laevis]